MLKAGLREALRFTACLTDGTDLYAFRWASDGRAPTLYWRQTGGNLVVVSEPLDGDRTQWTEVPQGCVLVARSGRPAVLHGLDEAIAGRAPAKAA
jgi:predicted glutamine amidotransferase